MKTIVIFLQPNYTNTIIREILDGFLYFYLDDLFYFITFVQVKDVKDDDVWADLFMDDSTKELKQIFEGQSAMAETVKALHNKMDQILGKKKLWDHGKN